MPKAKLAKTRAETCSGCSSYKVPANLKGKRPPKKGFSGPMICEKVNGPMNGALIDQRAAQRQAMCKPEGPAKLATWNDKLRRFVEEPEPTIRTPDKFGYIGPDCVEQPQKELPT